MGTEAYIYTSENDGNPLYVRHFMISLYDNMQLREGMLDNNVCLQVNIFK